MGVCSSNSAAHPYIIVPLVDPRIRRENDSDKKSIYNKTRINLEQNHDNWLELTYGLISIANTIPLSIMALAFQIYLI